MECSANSQSKQKGATLRCSILGPTLQEGDKQNSENDGGEIFAVTSYHILASVRLQGRINNLCIELHRIGGTVWNLGMRPATFGGIMLKWAWSLGHSKNNSIVIPIKLDQIRILPGPLQK